MHSGDVRTELSQFLKSRRGRLRPEDVGLPRSRRRRLPGLRREEVAALAGVGDTWYGLFESGKPIAVSRKLVESVSEALRLTSDEARYLLSLASPQHEVGFDFAADTVTPLAQRMLDAIEHAPAFIVSQRMDYLASNLAGRAVYALDDFRDPEANVLWRVFIDPRAVQLYPQWEQTAQRAVQMFRANYGAHVGNDSFERLISELMRRSAAFRAMWESHDVASPVTPISSAIVHPTAGTYSYRLISLTLAGSRGQELIVMLPEAEADERLVRRLVMSPLALDPSPTY